MSHAVVDVLLTGRLDGAGRGAWLRALRKAAPEFSWWSDGDGDMPREAIAAAVVANPAPGALAGMPRLRLVQSLWAGVEGLLADDTLPAQVPLARMVDPAMSAAMAETALWAVLALHRRFFDYAAQQSKGNWQPLPQRRAGDIRVLVLGLGAMGGAVAARLAAQGYRTTGWRAAASDRPVTSGVAMHAGEAALPSLLAATDIVVNLLPLTASTRGLIDTRFLAALPRGASIVNLARGAHVDDATLLAALDSGWLDRAVLDVFCAEPLPTEHRYWRHPKVTMLPHAAALTDVESSASLVAANLRALRDGAPLRHLVDRARGY